MPNQKSQHSGKRSELIKEGEDLKIEIGSDYRYLFGAHRVAGKTVQISADLESEIRAWFNKVNAAVGAICGSVAEFVGDFWEFPCCSMPLS
jgi:hypothetical protein